MHEHWDSCMNSHEFYINWWVHFWLLHGVKDTVDVKQWRTKGQKNEENNENNLGLRGGVLSWCVFCPLHEEATLSV